VYPGSTLFVTRNCTQQQFLLRPDREATNAFIYCIAVAAQKYDIDVIDLVQMSNHLHDEIYDRHGNAPAFYEHFHKLLAKCINALRGRWENVFATEQVSVVRIETTEAMIDKLVYIATNPVKDGLVAHVEDWPGAIGFRALQSGEPLRATRPTFFFAADGDMPEEVTLQLTIPPELGNREEILAEVAMRVAAVERDEARKRAESGRTVLGRYAVLRKSWRDTPMSHHPRRELNPRIAARNRLALFERIESLRDFVRQHALARAALLAGEDAVFPYGTYWLRRFMGVAVASSEISC